MEYQRIRGFLDMQMSAAEKAQDDKEAGMLYLLMADYLLEQVQKHPDVFLQEDTGELRRAFLRSASAGERLKLFYESYHKPLQEEAARLLERLNSNLERLEEQKQKLEELKELLEKTEIEEKQVREQSEEVLQREEELKKRHEDFMHLQKTIADCKEILANITPEQLELLASEKETLALQASEREQARNVILEETESIRKQWQELKDECDKLTAEKQEKEAKEQHKRDEIAEQTQKIQNLQESNQKLEQELQGLLAEISKAGDDSEELQAYLTEIKKIEEKLLEEGFFDTDSFREALQAVKQQADEVQNTYDTLLKNVLEDARTVYESIKNRQRN